MLGRECKLPNGHKVIQQHTIAHPRGDALDLLQKLLHELVVDPILQNESGARNTGLTGRYETCEGGAGYCRWDVCVVEDDYRCLQRCSMRPCTTDDDVAITFPPNSAV